MSPAGPSPPDPRALLTCMHSITVPSARLHSAMRSVGRGVWATTWNGAAVTTLSFSGRVSQVGSRMLLVC